MSHLQARGSPSRIEAVRDTDKQSRAARKLRPGLKPSTGLEAAPRQSGIQGGEEVQTAHKPFPGLVAVKDAICNLIILFLFALGS